MDNEDNIIELTPEKIAKLKNLKPYKNKSEEEIRAIFMNKAPRRKPAVNVTVTTGADDLGIPSETLREWDRLFAEKMDILQKEYSVDMNNSNDAEGLSNLARFQIQLDFVGKQIHDLQKHPSLDKDDVLVLEKLGNFQRTIMTSINDLQRDLGISRKQRKEKQVDDIPVWIESVLQKAKTFYDRKTITIDCPKCMVELSRYWLNFPAEKNDIEMSLTCWKCKEVIEYTG
jgi:hypothetical protein